MIRVSAVSTGAVGGHLWTIRPWLQHAIRPAQPPASVPWTTTLDDPRAGTVRLHGRLTARPGAREICVVVHGLGGSSATHYTIAAARAVDAAGMACLRLDLRGAPGDGEDLYNAGLTADVRAAVASPALTPYEAIYVLGYSLRYATEDVDPRLRAVAAVCPPIDLARGAEAIDHPARWVYRRHVLSGLKDHYAAVIARRPLAGLPSIAEARGIDSIRVWDERIVAPRFGYRSAAHYYAEATVAPRLGRLARPALAVVAPFDPMIPEETVRPALSGGHAMLDVRWIHEGGHVGFPGSVDLGMGGETGVEAQVVRWLRKAGEA